MIPKTISSRIRIPASNQIVFYVTIVVFVWIFTGAFVYWGHYKWTFAQAFYYSVQSGVSIGYGLLPESDDLTRFYTIFHALFGATLFGFALTVFAHLNIQKVEKITTDIEDRFLDDFNHSFINFAKMGGILRSSIYIFLVIIIGTIFGMVVEHWTFTSSVYFAVTTCSTGGLQEIEYDSPDWKFWFVGMYALLSVPTYGYTLAQFANYVNEKRQQTKLQEKMEQRLELAHFEYVKALGPDDVIDLSEFCILRFLQTGKITRRDVDEINKYFKRLDASGDGLLNKVEFLANTKKEHELKGNPSWHYEKLIKDIKSKEAKKMVKKLILQSDDSLEHSPNTSPRRR